jgi:hypothetical protein
MGAKTWLAFCAGLIALAIVFSYPLVGYMRTGMPYSFMPVPGLEMQRQYPGDYIQLMYRFWLFGRALAGQTPFFLNAYEFSTPLTPPRFSTQGIPLSLVFLIFTPWGTIFAYNMLVLLSFLASGAAMALLAYEFTRSRGAAIACGFLYACIPYRLGHLYGGHMGGFVFFLMPLALYCIEKSWRKSLAAIPGEGGRGAGWGFAFGLCVLCAAVTELHLSFYMGVLFVLYVICRCVDLWARAGFRSFVRAAWPPLAGMALPLAVVAGYLLWVKLYVIRTSVMGEGRPLATVQAFSPMIKDIFSKSANAEKNICLGFLPLMGGLYGIWVRRTEIRQRRAEHGALLWFYFWMVLFVLCYMLSLGTTLDRYIPFYSLLHAKAPFFAYSRTSSRIIYLALPPFLLLCGYGVKNLLARGRLARAGVWIFITLALVDYHPKGRIGISTLRDMGSVYKEVQSLAHGKRLLELPLWPGDSAWSSIYEYYATLTSVPIVNGYNPAPQLDYIRSVFAPLRSLNYGEMRQRQYDLLRQWDVPRLVLHQDLFPRKVSRYPFRFTLRNFLASPYLEFALRDGPNHLFIIREAPLGPEPRFTLESPVGNLYPARRMRTDVGSCIHDSAASSGSCMAAGTHGEKSGLLVRGNERIYPTGGFSVFFNLQTDMRRGVDQVARIDVYAPESEKVLAERLIRAGDFARPGEYRLFELRFVNREPAPLEFRVHYLGNGVLNADFVYVLFSGEKDPCQRYEAEDLFHIGSCVEDPNSSGGYAITITKDEDITMPMVSGPDRLYGPGCYRASFYLKARDAEAGTIASLDVASSFGRVQSKRDLCREELKESAGYSPYEVMFTLDRITPLSFTVRHYKRAILSLDKIEVEGVPPGDFLSHAADDKLAR